MSRPRLDHPVALDPEIVLKAYAMGVFPMADDREASSVYWVEPKRRGILPLDRFHLSRSLRKTIVADRYRVTADTAFAEVLALCATSAEDRPDTWINRSIETVFVELHRRGHAHSIECWHGDRLVGGLYGLALGRAFFGESMVSRARDASKVALAWLVARLRVGGFTLLDCQFQTNHLASLGAIEIDRARYVSLLGAALGDGWAAGLAGGVVPAGGDFRALDFLPPPAVAGVDSLSVPSPVSGYAIAQLLGQTS